MPKVVISHAVSDVETWLKYKAQRAADLAPYSSQVTDHVAIDGSNNVAITADIHDMTAFRAAIASPSPEIVASMERQGVILPLTVCLER